jgi:hypothetical protein
VKKIYNEGLHDLYSSPIIPVIKSRRMRWAGHVARMRTMMHLRILVEKLEGKRRLGIPRSKWEDNIKMDLQEAVWVAWIHFLA